MVAKFGPVNGFGWSMGDIIALQVVEVPSQPARDIFRGSEPSRHQAVLHIDGDCSASRIEANVPICRAGQERAIVVWDAAALRRSLSHTSAPEFESLASASYTRSPAPRPSLANASMPPADSKPSAGKP